MEGIGESLQQVEDVDRIAKKKQFAIFTIVERAERSFWCRIGAGFVNRDGSFNLHFDALPVNGTAHLREVEPNRRPEGAYAAREPLEGEEVQA